MGGMHRPTAPKCQVALRIVEGRVHVHGLTAHALYRGPPRPASVAHAMLTESALSYLGLGVRPPGRQAGGTCLAAPTAASGPPHIFLLTVLA
jgi:hypothetical protein